MINRMRSTTSWVGCPAVARQRVCGLAPIGLYGAPTAATGIDHQLSAALKPFPARPFEELSP